MLMVGLALLGFVAAVVASITGGGSLLTVPVMMLVGMSPATAVATNMLVLTSLSAGAAARFHRNETIPLHPTLGLIALSVPGSLLGAWIAVRLSDGTLQAIIAVAMLATALLILTQPDFGLRSSDPSRARRTVGCTTALAITVRAGVASSRRNQVTHPFSAVRTR